MIMESLSNGFDRRIISLNESEKRSHSVKVTIFATVPTSQCTLQAGFMGKRIRENKSPDKVNMMKLYCFHGCGLGHLCAVASIIQSSLVFSSRYYFVSVFGLWAHSWSILGKYLRHSKYLGVLNSKSSPVELSEIDEQSRDAWQHGKPRVSARRFA